MRRGRRRIRSEVRAFIWLIVAVIGVVGGSVVALSPTPAGADPPSYPVISAQMSSAQSLPDMYGPYVTITYTIEVSNSGLAPATGVTVTARVPDGPHYIGSTGGGVMAGTTVTWSDLSVPVGGSISETFSVTVGSGFDGTVVSDHATFTNLNTPTDHCIQSADTDPNTCDTNTASLKVAFWLVKVTQYEPSPGDTQPVLPGEKITYKFTMISTGHLAGSGSVTDTIPTGSTYVPGSATPDPVTYYPPSLYQSGQLVWTPWVPAVSGTTPGEVDLTYQVTVDPSTPIGSTITNVALLGSAGTTATTQGYLACQGTTTRACFTNTVSNPVRSAPSTPTAPPASNTVTSNATPLTTAHSLAFTGSGDSVLALSAAALIGCGTVLLLVVRRRSGKSSSGNSA